MRAPRAAPTPRRSVSSYASPLSWYVVRCTRTRATEIRFRLKHVATGSHPSCGWTARQTGGRPCRSAAGPGSAGRNLVLLTTSTLLGRLLAGEPLAASPQFLPRQAAAADAGRRAPGKVVATGNRLQPVPTTGYRRSISTFAGPA